MSHDHMDMDGSSESMVMMVPWLHFTPGDTLLFKGWVPKKPGPIFGACVALFLLAMVDRWLAAVRRFMELWWAEQARRMLSRKFVELNDRSRSEEDKVGEIPNLGPQRREASLKLSRDKIPPFIITHDLSRGLFVVFQTAITYTLMLTVMTFNMSFILAILIGLGVGEVLFGRLAYSSLLHAGH